MSIPPCAVMVEIDLLPWLVEDISMLAEGVDDLPLLGGGSKASIRVFWMVLSRLMRPFLISCFALVAFREAFM